MPCFFVLLALVTPRLVILLLWLFTNWFTGLFVTALVPVVAFFFVPTTLLWYSAVQRWFGGEWTLWPVLGLVAALAIDLSPASGRRAKRA